MGTTVRAGEARLAETTTNAVRDPLTYSIIGGAIDVSKELGIGLFESVYERCLACELTIRGHTVQRQPLFPLEYRGLILRNGFRPDLVVDSKVIVEVKAIAALTEAHDRQILTYMKFSRIRTGLLINFHAFPFARSIRRFVL